MGCEIVYILGAGCSKEDGAPLVNEFFDVAFNEVEPCLDADSEARFEKVREFRNNELPKANIEELLSYIDTEKVLRTRSRDFDLDNLRNDLIYLIAKTIQVQMETGVLSSYTGFQENVLYAGMTNEPTIISFNWDIALDNALTFSEGRTNLAIDYGSDFKYFDGDTLKKADRTRTNAYRLLKLHGSLNWLFCETCTQDKNKYFLYGEKVMVEIAEGRPTNCPICHKPLLPVIVPPTFNKLENTNFLSLLRELWALAFKDIEEAERIVIVGYSFPEDDVHFKLFFRSALFANYMKNNKPILIDVINYQKYLSDKTEFEAHYKKMIDIPGAEVRPNFHYLKFSEFASGELGQFFENEKL